jgi:hypothetical protein
MQALTVAIGTTGIQYFAQELVAQALAKSLSGLKPPDRQIRVPDFTAYLFGSTFDISKFTIRLTNGSTSGLKPSCRSVAQQKGGQFQLTFSASNFNAKYAWNESYHYSGTTWTGQSQSGDTSQDYAYSPGVGSLDTTVTVGFAYNQAAQSYDLKVTGASGTASGASPNIPEHSILKWEQGCFVTHVSDVTAQSVAAIDFNPSLARLVGEMVSSIRASGQLTPDIHYEFDLGDSGLTFPGDQGIAIGVTGRVSYKGQYFPGAPPAPLPVPPPPTDGHHLQTYVSDYELNTLHWAFFQAGLLTTTVNPSDLPDPDVLKVKTYASAIPALQPYAACVMQAQVSAKAPPTVAFQEVYEFTRAVMQALQPQLPSNVYQQLAGVDGNGYVSKADLESDLSGAGVEQAWFDVIEKAARSMGMVVTQRLAFTLTIQNGANPAPTLVFDVARVDILVNLGLGMSGNAQTLQYGFKRVKAQATLVSTTIPHFDRQDFGSLIWPVAGEPRYDATLAAMGKTGVPLPMMKDLQFHFEQAQVTMQQGYVAVLAQVALKGGR